MIKNIQIKVVWAWLVVATVALSSSLTLISPRTVSAASNYTWAGSSQINSANPKEAYNALSGGSFCSTDGCIYSNFGHTGAHPSNCKISGVPDPHNDSQQAPWPGNVDKIIQVANVSGGVNDGQPDTSAKTATLYALSNGSGGNCNVSTTTIVLDQGSSTSPNGADYAYTGTSTIRNIHNGDTYQAGGDKTVYNQQYGSSAVKCPDYIKLPSAGATTGTLHIATEINASKCEYDNRANSESETGPLPVTITRTAPTNIPADPHTNDQTATDDCTVPPETDMRWLSCDLISLGNGASEAMDRVIQNFLYTPTDQVFSDQLKTAWNSFRIIGVVLVLIAGLVMVISQAIGLELFDAYTVKKVLPRLIVAAIGISLSWPLMKLAVTFTNDIGGWAHDIILYPFKDMYNHAIGSLYVGGVIMAAAIPATIILLGPLGTIALIGTIILGILVALLVLAIRQIVILMAVVMAPLAIAAYILPGTQKLWTFWKDAFLTSLLMFPIIMGFIAGGKALAAVAASVTDSPELHLLSVLAYFAPYFLLPFAFKLAGGLMATIFSIANDRNKGAFDRLSKLRQGAGAQHRERTIGRQVLQKRADFAQSLRTSASRQGRGRFAGGMQKLAARSIEGYNVEAAMSSRRAAVTKELRDQIDSGQDDQIRALTVNRETSRSRLVKDANGNDIVQRETLGGAWVNQADVDRAYSRWGGDTFAQKTALSYEMSKANSEDEVAGISKNYRALAQGPGGWNQSRYEAGGTWIGAAFENQNQHIEYKKTDWESGRVGYDGLVDELYEKKGSYPLAQMHSQTIEELKNGYTDAGRIISTGKHADGRAATTEDIARARDRQEKIQGISETFMHSYGARTPDGEVMDAAAAGGGSRQASTPGAAHVAERVRELASLTGVYGASPSGNYSQPNHAPTPNRREQS